MTEQDPTGPDAAPKPALRVLPGTFDIHRLPGDAAIPPALLGAPWTWIARTADELSIVCRPDGELAARAEVSAGWSAIQVAGPIPHDVVGLLADLSRRLAEARITLFALSTYDTDYVLVRTDQLDGALTALGRAGYPTRA